MHCRVSVVSNILLLVIIISLSYGVSVTGDKCYQSYEVNHSTIIRTQDSKNEGAKYLDEAEKSSNEDCLNWCCQTTNCTVAVYEEKKQGSCYLFDCGPVGKKLCKFTAYNNYTSSILKISRHAVELEQWSSSSNLHVSSTGATVRSTESLPTEAPVKVKEHQRSECGRNQFECRNDSTCIAIYNVCDGVYQCSDRSDEGPGLGCPEDETAAAAADGRTSAETDRHDDDEHEHSEDRTVKVKPTEKSVLTTKKMQPQPPWKNKASSFQRDNSEPYKQYQRENYNQFDAEPEVAEKIPVMNQMHPLNIGKPEKQDALFYHKGLHLISPSESYSQHQYKHQNLRPDITDFQSEAIYDNQDFGGGMKTQVGSHSQHRNNYQDYYPANPPVEYQNSRFRDMSNIVQNVPADNDERYKGQKQSYQHYHNPQNFYDTNGKQVIQEQYSRLNYPSAVYESRPSQQMLAHRPVGNYDLSAQQQTVQNPAGDMLDRPQYAEVPVRIPIKPVYSDQPKIRYSGSGQPATNNNILDLSGQEISKGNNYPIAEGMDGQIYLEKDGNVGGRTSAEVYHPNIKPRRPRINHQQQKPTKESVHVVSHESDQLKKQMLPVLSTSIEPTLATKSTPPEVHLEPKKKVSKESTTSILDEINLSELEVNGKDSSQSNGAVLALSLGLVLTGVLVVLVGCRLKVVRHRILRGRNGRSPLAHDADYLVNGMYL